MCLTSLRLILLQLVVLDFSCRQQRYCLLCLLFFAAEYMLLAALPCPDAPPAGPSKEASVQQRNSQQMTATKTVMELLATSFLAPPQSKHCAVISIMHSSNRCAPYVYSQAAIHLAGADT
jgi:cobalamin synthase